jgi:hypothetical protein
MMAKDSVKKIVREEEGNVIYCFYQLIKDTIFIIYIKIQLVVANGRFRPVKYQPELNWCVV